MCIIKILLTPLPHQDLLRYHYASIFRLFLIITNSGEELGVKYFTVLYTTIYVIIQYKIIYLLEKIFLRTVILISFKQS